MTNWRSNYLKQRIIFKSGRGNKLVKVLKNGSSKICGRPQIYVQNKHKGNKTKTKLIKPKLLKTLKPILS